MTAVVHHLVAAADWERDFDDDLYRPASLEADGFVHFSATSQVRATSLRHFADVDDLLVVTVAVERLRAELRWENLVGHGSFPHLYGGLNADAVIAVQPYTAGDALTDRWSR